MLLTTKSLEHKTRMNQKSKNQDFHTQRAKGNLHRHYQLITSIRYIISNFEPVRS